MVSKVRYIQQQYSHVPQYDQYGEYNLRSYWGSRSSARSHSRAIMCAREKITHDDIADVLHVCASNKDSRRKRQQTMKRTHGDEGRGHGSDMKREHRAWSENTTRHGHRAQALDSNIHRPVSRSSPQLQRSRKLHTFELLTGKSCTRRPQA